MGQKVSKFPLGQGLDSKVERDGGIFSAQRSTDLGNLIAHLALPCFQVGKALAFTHLGHVHFLFGSPPADTHHRARFETRQAQREGLSLLFQRLPEPLRPFVAPKG